MVEFSGGKGMTEKLIVHDWHMIRHWLEPRLGKIKLVSVDLFDTVLQRCIEPPALVQQVVCRALSQRLDLPFTQVWQARQQAEQTLRQQALAQGLDHECRFSELVVLWVQTLIGQSDAELQAFILQAEVENEIKALQIKPDAKVFLDWAKAQGLTLIATSDMYLDSEILSDILERKQLKHYFLDLYVSAEVGLGKYTGRLFKHILQKNHLNPEQMLHIGDNPISDRLKACEQQIQGIWLYEKAELRRREQQALSSTMAQRGGIWLGRHFFECVQTRIQQQASLNSPNFFYRYGRDVLGPAFSVCMQGILERLQQQRSKQESIDKLFFIARDGYLFEKLYRSSTEDIPAEYVYLSRRVITAASTAKGLTHAQAVVAFYNPKQCGLESVCKVYGLPIEDLKPLAQAYGFTNFAEPIQQWDDSRLYRFLQDPQVQAIISHTGEQHQTLLERYLEQIGFFAQKRVALIDIGWNGTIQRFLKQAFGHRADFPIVHGYYFAFVPKMYSDFGLDNYCEGIIHDSRRGNPCERMPAEFEEIFEQGARSGEATTMGYQVLNDQVEPVLKPAYASDRQAELSSNPSIACLQAGVLHHWEHFKVIQHLTGYTSQQLLPYVHGLLERAVVYPTTEEIHELTQLVHTEDFGHDHILALGQPKLTWLDLCKPRQLWQRFKQVAWRYALLEGLPNHFNFACRIAYLRLVEK